MTPQSCLVHASSGEAGDCLRACVATILDLPARDVPNFVHLHDFQWGEALRDWLRERGYALFHRWCEGENWTLDEVLLWYSGANPDCPMILTGASKTDPNDNHAVVLRDGKIAHDPSNQGISGPSAPDGESRGGNFNIYVIARAASVQDAAQ